VGKAKVQLKLKMARDINNCNKRFFRYVNNKQKQKENICLLLNRRGELVTNNAEKAEVLNTFFVSVFTSTVGPQALGKKKCGLMQTQTHHQWRKSWYVNRSVAPTNRWALTSSTTGVESWLMSLRGHSP